MTDLEPTSVAAKPAAATVAVVVVTYDSGSVIGMCLDALAAQTRRADSVIVVDNNSQDAAYLNEISSDDGVRVVRNTVNEGFCAANNRAYRMVRDHRYVMLLNPDAFLDRDAIRRAVEWMERPGNARVGVLTGTLLGFDIRSKQRTGVIDSTGVFQTWYGKWYDRYQGQAWLAARASASTEDVPAVAGALMFCRSEAIDDVRTPKGEVFDDRFFMYKEDIELSLRLRKRGWRLVYWPGLLCDHCRGWQGRRHMSKHARYLSARNELRVCFANNGKGIVYSALKFLYVPLEDIVMKLSRSGRPRGPRRESDG